MSFSQAFSNQSEAEYLFLQGPPALTREFNISVLNNKSGEKIEYNKCADFF